MSRCVLRSATVVTVAVFLPPLTPARCSAGIIYDNGLPNQVYAAVSEVGMGQEADDFALNGGENTIDAVNWWGLYAPSDTPSEPDAFSLRFFTNFGSLPSASPLVEYFVGDVGRSFTGLSIGDSDLYAYSASIPSTLLSPDTTYWISVVNDTSLDADDNWFWAASGAAADLSATRYGEAGEWPSYMYDFAFQLEGPSTASVAEPSSVTVILLAALSLGGARWRRKRKKPA